MEIVGLKSHSPWALNNQSNWVLSKESQPMKFHKFQYVGSNEYHIFQWPHNKFNMYLLLKNQQLKYFVIQRKRWGLHWVIIDLQLLPIS